MALVLLIAAVICWLVAGSPGFVSIALGRVDFGWLGMFFFGLWLLLGGSGTLVGLVRRA